MHTIINIHTWRERERLRLLTMHTIEADTYKQPAILLLNPRGERVHFHSFDAGRDTVALRQAYAVPLVPRHVPQAPHGHLLEHSVLGLGALTIHHTLHHRLDAAGNTNAAARLVIARQCSQRVHYLVQGLGLGCVRL